MRTLCVVGDCRKSTRRFQEQILWAELFTQSCLWPQVRLVWTHLSTLEMQSMNFTSICMSLFYPSNTSTVGIFPRIHVIPVFIVISFTVIWNVRFYVHKGSFFPFNCLITVAKSCFTVCPFELLEFGLFESTEGHKERIPTWNQRIQNFYINRHWCLLWLLEDKMYKLSIFSPPTSQTLMSSYILFKNLTWFQLTCWLVTRRSFWKYHHCSWLLVLMFGHIWCTHHVLFVSFVCFKVEIWFSCISLNLEVVSFSSLSMLVRESPGV